jgi:hypothetical protein
VPDRTANWLPLVGAEGMGALLLRAGTSAPDVWSPFQHLTCSLGLSMSITEITSSRTPESKVRGSPTTAGPASHVAS